MEYLRSAGGGLGLVEWDLFFRDGMDQFIKSDRDPLSIANIPLFQSSKGGSATFHYSIWSLR
ncbi:hypothetical protein JY97_07185 [Alkalispirochaeta odontotermitis]|nr:hypothetical protein JY97_07185 [Alkalispirochaeta odontotermitis]CAB1083717.1 hypothetical protein D1AOALGA4SA_11258 [Olavius algarvensis Delta 1 endosymbiont]